MANSKIVSGNVSVSTAYSQGSRQSNQREQVSITAPPRAVSTVLGPRPSSRREPWARGSKRVRDPCEV